MTAGVSTHRHCGRKARFMSGLGWMHVGYADHRAEPIEEDA